jgi:hypothetical protein
VREGERGRVRGGEREREGGERERERGEREIQCQNDKLKLMICMWT